MKAARNIGKIIFVLLFAVAWNYVFAQPAAMAVISAQGTYMPYEIGQASFYSYECANLPMANGRPFDPEQRTCASWFYPFGTVLNVTSVDTGLSTEVVVTDRGPNKRLVKEGRIIDLSRRAFEDICFPAKGLTNVTVSVKSPPKS
jgi:rare lipoprotein A